MVGTVEISKSKTINITVGLLISILSGIAGASAVYTKSSNRIDNLTEKAITTQENLSQALTELKFLEKEILKHSGTFGHSALVEAHNKDISQILEVHKLDVSYVKREIDIIHTTLDKIDKKLDRIL